MAQTPKRRQASLERKAAKRKEKQQTVRQLAPPGPREVLRSAGNWPLEECLITRDWNRAGELVQIVIARRSPGGQVAAGAFLVDLGCLGVKSAMAGLFATKGEYERNLRERVMELQPRVKCDLNLAARVIREGLNYARSLGFSPDPDFREASVLLEGADPDASAVRVPLGKDGKPFYVAGPHDNARRIMATLVKAVGPEGFHYVVPVDPSTLVFPEAESGGR